jgi:PEP-CTERM motif
MRRILPGLFLAVLGTCQVASAAAISVAGTDCGTDQLLGLSFIVPITGTNIPTGTACPENNLGVGSIVGDNGSGGTGPLYGSPITSIEFTLSDLSQLEGLEVLAGSALGTGEGGITFTRTGFILSGGAGISIFCGPLTGADLDGSFCSPIDAVILFRGFEPGTEFTVSAVNGITVPEPASLALLAMGAGAAAIRRRRARSRLPL